MQFFTRIFSPISYSFFSIAKHSSKTFEIFSHWFILYYHFLDICRPYYKTTNVIVFQLDNHPVFCYGFRKFAHGGWNQQLQSSELKCYQRFHVKFRLRLDNVIQIELLTVQGLETEIKPENVRRFHWSMMIFFNSV